MPVSVTNDQRLPVQTATLMEAARRVLRSAKLPSVQVDILLTDDMFVRKLNHTYRGMDRSTDVLSFAQRDDGGTAPPVPRLPHQPEILGDVVISVDTAARQAEEHHISLDQELALLAVHGILHLLGFEDDTEQGAAVMHCKERDLLGFTFPAAALPD